jgi:hypothetical protein
VAHVTFTQSSLKEDVRRDVLLKLRDSFEKRLLAVPNRYVRLSEELWDFSYTNPSSGYVLALAFAVSLASQADSSLSLETPEFSYANSGFLVSC